jgi:8-amino-7-oxononanoate synthase
MPDFTSALYLGLEHSSRALPAWRRLTTGRPAVLEPASEAAPVAAALAALQGCAAATLAPSTLHLFWDLFGIVAGEGTGIAVDGGTYAVARWGAERAAARGVPVRGFAHRDADALGRVVADFGRVGLRPVVVTDGYCVLCGVPTPLPAYLDRIRPAGGLLVVDDTQALGILGGAPGPGRPFGRHGGGSLRWHGLAAPGAAPECILVSSVAKAFGAPLAALSGERTMVERFERLSETRVHCSPPSSASLAAAANALRLNSTVGEALRRHLADLVRRFQEGARSAGLRVPGGPFPVQMLDPGRPGAAARLHRRLLASGIRTILLRGHAGFPARIGVLITARHQAADIDRLVEALTSAARPAVTGLRSSEVCHVERW